MVPDVTVETVSSSAAARRHVPAEVDGAGVPAAISVPTHPIGGFGLIGGWPHRVSHNGICPISLLCVVRMSDHVLRKADRRGVRRRRLPGPHVVAVQYRGDQQSQRHPDQQRRDHPEGGEQCAWGAGGVARPVTAGGGDYPLLGSGQ
ncbi:hypothetical protein [Gordonia sp. DT101]|uniref:hypothetical protein n=1 Tax=Gordonia sp. DT101 TaxID=3416545 RepID=UPI003CFA9E34